ncbi:exopolysaccharide biosynthesis polyprenyl glycosylphosphotransferase [Halomonas cerina]|uniref:Exopolysaccharide biosynthesis polyprenyl glycosylphosphotransferase n=1 Tax=Halomonas cerina TaxID=447424 RepID=A0A839V5Z2_9GAMM|nr:exopolysaccharide biosynthesis polyprenyl glycosylphosphotransferase [Halomonas cerina]MBB3189418.1 exopolysaccharide biosynthesis polyprenyl glycosylphosphotransferase [Halomonas cerina]
MDTVSIRMEQQRRHSRLYERVMFSRRVQLLLGLMVVVGLPAMLRWGWGFWSVSSASQWAAIVATIAAFWLSITAVYRLSELPGTKAYVYILPTITLCYLVAYGGLKALGLEQTTLYMLLSYLFAVGYCSTGYFIGSRVRRLKLAVVPYGKAPSLCQNHSVDWRMLETPSLEGSRVDGVVADLRAELPDDWAQFLADCTIHRIPVYHATKAHEMITGRVLLDHLYENQYGSLSPREDYEIIKRGLDALAVLLVMPLALPIMAATAIAIRLDSPGPAIFRQPRMGFHCRPFVVYKFRSMVIDHDGTGFTQDGHDPRITRVGHVIRKYRLDELPQLFNVLKGDMSLIGPRPESMNLADWYERDVPFFHYRHVVRPGISGWAQVEQGYAAEVDGMIRKLEYDFYYIKHFSFWLDVLIVIRTVKTMLTGFGSR